VATFRTSTAVPADNGSNGGASIFIGQPSGYSSGDLLVLAVQVRANGATITITSTGGQTWTPLTAQDLNSNSGSGTVRFFYCVFTGTWGSNVQVATGQSGTVAGTAVMMGFAPTGGLTWSHISQSLAGNNAPSSPFTATVTGTTNQTRQITIAVFASDDDNTWGNMSGTGWTQLGQYRNTSGQDQSINFAYRLDAAAGSYGNVTFDQTANGGDPYVSGKVIFAEIASVSPITGNARGSSYGFSTITGWINITGQMHGAARTTADGRLKVDIQGQAAGSSTAFSDFTTKGSMNAVGRAGSMSFGVLAAAGALTANANGAAQGVAEIKGIANIDAAASAAGVAVASAQAKVNILGAAMGSSATYAEATSKIVIQGAAYGSGNAFASVVAKGSLNSTAYGSAQAFAVMRGLVQIAATAAGAAQAIGSAQAKANIAAAASGSSMGYGAISGRASASAAAMGAAQVIGLLQDSTLPPTVEQIFGTGTGTSYSNASLIGRYEVSGFAAGGSYATATWQAKANVSGIASGASYVYAEIAGRADMVGAAIGDSYAESLSLFKTQITARAFGNARATGILGTKGFELIYVTARSLEGELTVSSERPSISTSSQLLDTLQVDESSPLGTGLTVNTAEPD
jgi:hypothetical protein